MRSHPRGTTTILWFGLLALALTIGAGGIWTVLLAANLATSPAIPWAVVVMGALLWLMWWYLGGHGGPERTQQARRDALRAKRVPGTRFIWALLAGLFAILALAGLWFVLFQLAGLPPRALPDYGKYPVVTVALVLIMASLVSSLAEEAGFRGYFQGTLERRVGSIGAILIAAAVIAPAHALTQGFVWPVLLFYLFVDITFGAMAYLTQSIVPGAIMHAVGLFLFFTLVWSGDALRQIVGAGDANTWLWLHAAQTLIFALLALVAFRQLARRRASSPAPVAGVA